MRPAAEAMVEALLVIDVKLGVFSLWNGQQAFHSRPARCSFTVRPISADSEVRARSSSRNAGRDSRPIASRIGALPQLVAVKSGALRRPNSSATLAPRHRHDACRRCRRRSRPRRERDRRMPIIPVMSSFEHDAVEWSSREAAGRRCRSRSPPATTMDRRRRASEHQPSMPGHQSEPNQSDDKDDQALSMTPSRWFLDATIGD